MSHWRSVFPRGGLFEVSYEEVVDDLEGQARRLIDYCGLPWDDRRLTFDRTSRAVKTASAVQVRKPLFRSSLQRWRKYEAEIAPLLRELGDLMPLSSATAEAHSISAAGVG
jgi:Sulfotransferase family